MSTAERGGVPPLTLGWRLRMALEHSGVTVQEMADELGVTRQSLSRWMHDQGAPPKAAYVKVWALRTGAPFLWLSNGNIAPEEGGCELSWTTACQPELPWEPEPTPALAAA